MEAERQAGGRCLGTCDSFIKLRASGVVSRICVDNRLLVGLLVWARDYYCSGADGFVVKSALNHAFS